MIFDHNINNNNNALIEKITKSKKINKLLCTIQINNNTDKINEKTWTTTLQVDTIDWKKIYQTIFKATLDTSLRNFQYKIVMGILPTNTLLVKYKIKDNSLCDLCNNNEETISHLFWECTKTQILWHKLTEFLKNKNITFEKTRLEALLGITNGTHCYIKLKKEFINNLNETIYLSNETQQKKSFFYCFSQLYKRKNEH